MNSNALLEDYAFITEEDTQLDKKETDTEIFAVVEYKGNKLYCNTDSNITKSIAALISSSNESLQRYGQAKINDKQVIVTIVIEPTDIGPANLDEMLANVKKAIAKDKAKEF
jgi:hypothetical protein